MPNFNLSTTNKNRILISIILVGIIGIFFVPPIAQNPTYHQFADQTTLASIPNALNVLSNIFFACVGLAGLLLLSKQNSLTLIDKLKPAYILFFAGLTLVAFGSGYYHWNPDNQALVWDRLPMTIAFMSFLPALLAERVSPSIAAKLFPVLVIAGIASIVYWKLTEQSGHGDLRPYALIQFLPILLTPLILLLFDSRYDRSSDLWWFLFWYLVAKIFEAMDQLIYDWLILISGHSLKHIAASIGCFIYLRHLHRRQVVQR